MQIFIVTTPFLVKLNDKKQWIVKTNLLCCLFKSFWLSFPLSGPTETPLGFCVLIFFWFELVLSAFRNERRQEDQSRQIFSGKILQLQARRVLPRFRVPMKDDDWGNLIRWGNYWICLLITLSDWQKYLCKYYHKCSSLDYFSLSG